MVFLDETWAKTNMTRLRGRSIKGTRLVEHVPSGHWMTTTFLAAIRASGWVAPLVAVGAINGKLFLGWVEQHLTPLLRPVDVVIMDNLGNHKVTGIVDAIESVNVQVLYLPPYSPDFNPIELGFSKLKRTDPVCKTTSHRRAMTYLRRIPRLFLRIRVQKLLQTRWLPLHLNVVRSSGRKFRATIWVLLN